MHRCKRARRHRVCQPGEQPCLLGVYPQGLSPQTLDQDNFHKTGNDELAAGAWLERFLSVDLQEIGAAVADFVSKPPALT
jgi:hypothetical protein